MLEDVNERTKSYPEWKAATNEKVAQLELNDIQQNSTLIEINKNITAISTKMDLLLENRIKMEN